MDHWDIASLAVKPHQPEVLRSDDETRVIAINLPAGEALQEHQVHERAWLVVAAGEVEVEQGGRRRSPAAPACSCTSSPTSATRCARPDDVAADPAALALARRGPPE